MKAALTEERVREIVYEIVWPDQSPRVVKIKQQAQRAIEMAQAEAIENEVAVARGAKERMLVNRLKRWWDRRSR